MATGYSRAPKLLKGALVALTDGFLGPIPNIVVFQYNPEALTRTLKPYDPKAGDPNGAGSATSAQPYDPEESFNVVLELDATDALEHPESHPVAVLAGVSDRIAALEMMLYPQADASSGAIGAALSSLFGATAPVVPRSEVPLVLFVWGPGRILPVRLTSFQVEEQAFSPTLFPVRAKVTVGVTVLTPSYFTARADSRSDKTLTIAERLCLSAYKVTRGQKEALARANLANSVESILGMLPFG